MSGVLADLARSVVGGSLGPRSSEHTATVLRRDKGGTYWVHVPGGAEETPVTTAMSEASPGDSVRVTIANGRAVMTGNVSNPSASTTTVSKVGAVANRAMTIAYTEKARVDELQASMLTASSAVITDLKAEAAKVENLTADQLNSTVAYIGLLHAGDVSAENIIADHAALQELDVDSLTANFARIDFANVNAAEIGMAKIVELLANSGVFENLVIRDGVVTGQLKSVEIIGDLIRANTIAADKIIFQGEDEYGAQNGLWYKLNQTGAGGLSADELTDEKYRNALDGSNIVAHSVTATEIDVADLTADQAFINNVVSNTLLADRVQVGMSAATHIVMQGDRLSFLSGDGTEVAYIAVDEDTNESMFYITKAVVVKDLRFGHWKWADRRNGNLALKWVGDPI